MSIAPLVAEHSAILNGINRRAVTELEAVWRALSDADAIATRNVLLEVVPDITSRHGDLSAVSAADFYDEARASAGVRGRFTAPLAPTAPIEQVQVSVRAGLSPIFSLDPQWQVALSRLSGSVTRLVLQPARQTVAQSTVRDPARPRFARKPDPDACDWCLMLSSRGAVYLSEQSAGEMNDYHDRCRCEPVPVFRDDDLPEVNRRLHDEWQQVTRGAANSHDARERWAAHVAATRS